MNKVSFDSHWMFCCWLYIHGDFFLVNIDNSIGICLQGNQFKYRVGKNKQSHKQNPDPAAQSLPCSQIPTGQIQTKVWVTAQRKLWPRQECRCECCPLSPSLTNTLDTACSDLPFLRFLAHSYSAGFVHLHFCAHSGNPQKVTRKWIPPAVPALRSSCSQGGQRLVRTAPNNEQHHLSHSGTGTHHLVPSAEPLKLPKCLIICDRLHRAREGPSQRQKSPGCGLVWEVTLCSKAATLQRSSWWALQLRECEKSSNSNIFSATIQASAKIAPPTKNCSLALQREPASRCFKDSIMRKFLKDQRTYTALERDNAFSSKGFGGLYLLSVVKPLNGEKL